MFVSLNTMLLRKLISVVGGRIFSTGGEPVGGEDCQVVDCDSAVGVEVFGGYVKGVGKDGVIEKVNAEVTNIYMIVPEPATLILLGAAGLFLRRTGRRK